MSENINESMDYYRGYSDGYIKGSNMALEKYKKIYEILSNLQIVIKCDLLQNSRGFTKEEAKAHEDILNKIGTVVKENTFDLERS